MKARYQGKSGFTLTELMIVVAILGVLAAIAVPKLASTIHKAHAAMTLGNLAAMRSSLTVYMTAHEGMYPTDNLTSLVTEGFIREIPMVLVPPSSDGTFAGHPGGNSIDGGPRTAWGASVAKWYYFNDPSEPDWFGKIVINCGHNNDKGVPWDQL